MIQKITTLETGRTDTVLQAALRAWQRLLSPLGLRNGNNSIPHIDVRPIIFSVNCYIATILTMFIAFSLDLKSPGWAMTTVYLTSQPLSGALRAKALYRVVGTFVGGAAMVATDVVTVAADVSGLIIEWQHRARWPVVATKRNQAKSRLMRRQKLGPDDGRL